MHSIFEKASQGALNVAGKLLLARLLKLLQDPSIKADTQGLAYSAVGKLSGRMPELFRDKIELVERFFDAVATAGPQVRVAHRWTARTHPTP